MRRDANRRATALVGGVGHGGHAGGVERAHIVAGSRQGGRDLGAGLSEIAVNVSDKIGRYFTDILYIEVGGDKKCLPTATTPQADNGADVGVKFDVANLTTANLREHVVIVKDDYLLSFQVSPNSPSGLYAQPEPSRENGCRYVVDVEIKGDH